jgi:hypothetical protein
METLPKYYGGGTQTPWGTVTTTYANPYKSCPQTGAMRLYDFTVAECDIRPEGVETKKAVCVNGQFPGPLIEANYGDTIQVKVTNKLHDEGTSMHWHGFLQTGTNQMDGVPGVTQCAIAPGATMTYTFRAELYGTAWYHTHYSAQYAGGAVGPIVIYGPTNKNADVDIGPVMLSDWYRNDYMTNIRGLMRPVSEGGPINPLTNSNLINGKMRFPCSKTNLQCTTADYSTFNFTSGKNHLLRLVNTGSNAVQKFAIDGHIMQVISNDFMPVQPYNTSMIALGVGQRADIIVYGSGKPTDKVWMRSNIVGTFSPYESVYLFTFADTQQACSVNDGQLTEALGVIYYQDADTKALPTAGFNEGPAADTSPRWCGNDPLTVTVPSFPLKASTPAVTKYLDIRMKNNGTHMLLNFGDNSFRANFNDPILSRALVGISSNFEPVRNVWNVGPSKTMRAVISNFDPAPHPVSLTKHQNIDLYTLTLP